MKNVRYPVTFTCEPPSVDCTYGGPCLGHPGLLDVDELQAQRPETFARWVSLECTDTDEQINRVALAQAYHAQDAGLELAAADLRTLDGTIASAAHLARFVEMGDEESIRDAIFKVSRLLHDEPGLCDVGHTVARARLLAACEACGIDTEGNEDPAKLRGESRR